jgi:hypothetical protein
MDYRVYRSKEELESTGFIEIGPGKYSGEHWLEGFVFIWEDAFALAEGIVAKHFPEYDHFAMNDIPEEVGRLVTSEWRDVASRIDFITSEQLHSALSLESSYCHFLETELQAYREGIGSMLRDLANECDGFYERGEWICILGV